jgi:hypothetical protein
MIIGASIAYFSLLDSQKEEGTVLYTGKLEINYIDGVYIKNPELIPIKNPDYNTYEGVYRNSFAIASSGTLEQTIDLELEITRNEFTENAIRYAIFNEAGNRITSGYVPKEGKVTLATNMYLSATGTAKYTLIIWLDNTGYNQNGEMGKSISGKINIHSKQLRY